MTKGERLIKALDVCFMLYLYSWRHILQSYRFLCLVSFIDVSFWVETDYMSFIFVSCMRWDLFLLDVSFETDETWSLSCNIIYLSGLWTWENLWWVLCVWYTCVVSIFIRTMHVLEWKYMVWCFYIDSCVIYLVICITVLFCHTHLHPMDAMI